VQTDNRTAQRSDRRSWIRACVPLGCVALAACVAQPARLGPSPGDYEAFVREVMVEAGKAPGAAPATSARAVQRAADWLGKAGDGKNDGKDGE